jgi:signal transduction histidine kinase/CheY-like chemotaxis protein
MPIGTGSATPTDAKRRGIPGGAPLLLAILVAILILGMAWLAQRFLWNYAVGEAADDRLAAMDRNAFLIEARLRGRANDMFFLKRVAESELAHNPNASPTSDNFRNAVTTMMLARSQYDQIRLLNLQGFEIFRYNWKGGVHPLEEVTAANLQDKSNRPFYRETLTAGPEAAVFSPLDLNVDHNQIERPFKPVVRVSGQIVGPDGQPRALLILNYLGDQLLREVKQDTHQPRQDMLVNNDGYWLIGPDNESQWGFMFPEKKGANLKEQNPDLWSKIKSHTSGWISEDGYLYCFQNIDPIGSTTDYPPLRMSVLGGERLKWTLLSKIPDAVIWKGVNGIRHGIWATCAGLLMVLVPLVWFGGASLERRRRDVREVREARTMLDSVIEAAPHGIIVLESIRDEQNKIVDLRLTLSNMTAAELLGDDLLKARREGTTMLQAHPESKLVFDGFCRVIETGEPLILEEFYNRDVKGKWLSIRAAKREDGVVVTLVDATEMKEAEEKLRQSEMVQRLAGQMSKVGGWSVEFPSLKVHWTEELYHLHQMPFDFQPSVDDGVKFYAPEYRDKIREAFEGTARGGPPFDVEAEIITAKGERVWVRTTGETEFRDGKLARMVGAVQNITAAKNALLREQELRLQAQAAEQAKSEFLAVMSHEIRTPMNGVIGMTSILADTEMTEAQRDCVNTIHASGEALLTVINDILDFSKIESGKMTLESKAFDLRQCVEETLDLFAVQIRKKGIEAGYLIGAEVPTQLMGDSNRLRQILINLIGNAVKFTERGEITLRIQQQSRDEKGCHLLFSIKDTGIGISQEGIAKLFQSFQQVDSSTTRRYGGTGLGLVISRRLAELMEGRMWVESHVGAGSIFFFSVVLKAAPIQGSVGGAEPVTLTEGSVLIVDDNDTNRHILETQLKAWGMTTTSASSGRQALEKVKQGRFDVILLDLQMPEMDGVTLAREIRKNAQVPLILLSSSGSVEIGEAGSFFRYQIPKPVKQSLLFDALLEVAGRAVPDVHKTVARKFDPGMASRQPLRILLAEDNSVNQKVGLLMLGNLGYRADIADNGLQVLDAVKKVNYDLIFMDVQMPEMDGIEATRQLKQNLGEKCPVIVALTANALEGDREKFLAMGFDDYLSKPLSPDRLRGALERVSERRTS